MKKKLKCPKCGKTFRGVWGLRRHYRKSCKNRKLPENNNRSL